MNAKILEIFRSIQGEGPYAGVPQVFVRLFECNMHCVWCDTPASIGDGKREYREMTPEEVLAEVSLHTPELLRVSGRRTRGCAGLHSVSITGGEPLLQAEFLKDFCQALKAEGKKIYLDTNGTLPEALKAIIKDVDIVAMDIKLPSSTQQRAFWAEHEEFLKVARSREVFIKAVVSLNTSQEDLLKAAKLVAAVDPGILFILQPNSLDMKKGVVEACVEHQKVCAKILKDVRILPQVHKFMKLR